MNEQPSDDIRRMLEFELDASDDSDLDVIQESDHNTDTEQSAGEDAEEENPPQEQLPQQIQDQLPNRPHNNQPIYNAGNTNNVYVARDGTRWRMVPNRTSSARSRPCDIIRTLPGVRNEAKNAKTPIEALQLFFPDSLFEEIVFFTNKYIESIRNNYVRERDAAETTLVELKACIGLLFLGGVMKVSHTNIEELWRNDGTGIEIFRLTMGINRFRFLLKCIRFDDLETRAERKVSDKLAAVRSLIDQFNSNCKKHYNMSNNVTIDEMLDSFRGRCSFRQYIPNKPAKYGLKIFAMTDSKMYYTNNVEVYCGRQPEGPYKVDNDAHSIVK